MSTEPSTLEICPMNSTQKDIDTLAKVNNYSLQGQETLAESCLKKLIKIKDINYLTWLAFDYEYLRSAKLLLKEGGDPNFIPNIDNVLTPLLMMSVRGNLPGVDLLLSSNVDVNLSIQPY